MLPGKPSRSRSSPTVLPSESLGAAEYEYTLASSASASGETAVGVFESQRYMAIEATRLSHPDEMDVTAEFVRLLQESCDAVLEATRGAVRDVQAWFAEVRRGSFGGRAKVEKARAERLAKLEAAKAEHAKLLAESFDKAKVCV